jgi:hypothetical protein
LVSHKREKRGKGKKNKRKTLEIKRKTRKSEREL